MWSYSITIGVYVDLSNCVYAWKETNKIENYQLKKEYFKMCDPLVIVRIILLQKAYLGLTITKSVMRKISKWKYFEHVLERKMLAIENEQTHNVAFK